MKNDEERARLNATTRAVLGCAFGVSNTLGCGFLEKVYENALAIDLLGAGHTVVQQAHVEVLYKEQVVGVYCPDLVVDGSVILEIKAIDNLDPCHQLQCMNYLRATRLSVALLLNFGRPRIQYKRIVWDF